MGDFLKVFVRGIVVTLLLPFIALFLALYAAYLLVVFVIMFFRNTIVFFKGGTVKETKEDKIYQITMQQQAQMKQNAADQVADAMHQLIKEHPEEVKNLAEQQIKANQAVDINPEEIIPSDTVTEMRKPIFGEDNDD